MPTYYTNIVSIQELGQIHVKQSTPLLILDCRAKLGAPDWGRQAYASGHIPGALFAHLDEDLADPPNAHGRHPLPGKARWLDTIRRWGITNATQVVTYDDAGGAYAARAWWMLRWVGHSAVAVLDGGLGQYPDKLETDTPTAPNPSDFSEQASLTKLISSADLAQAVNNGAELCLLDARARERWAGMAEPIDAVAGHIPGATCVPFQENLTQTGCFKSPQALAKRFADQIIMGKDVICYCGSGVTATHNILAMNIAGYPEASLYADSWSGWITDSQRPIATSL